MAGNYTLTIIKPDAFGAGKAGKIIAHLEEKGFTVSAARVHAPDARRRRASSTRCTSERPFYGELVAVHDVGPVHADGAREGRRGAALRDAIGATDPAEAAAGTVRKLYAESKGRNAIHASDSDENAAREARFFFAETESRIVGLRAGRRADRRAQYPSRLTLARLDPVTDRPTSSFRGYAVL